MKHVAIVAMISLLGTAAAWGQSKKYPPVAPDKDLEEEQRSHLWESALHPDVRPYAELVKEAKRLIDHGTTEDVLSGLEKLDTAIQRMPDEPDAYLLRGQVELTQQKWAKCADHLAAAEEHAKGDDATARAKARLDLGICQARAGRYADSERTLIRATASAPAYKNELWMRLGEVRIALGKLDEAIDALLAASEMTEATDMTRWLLALAYDRARRPGDALEHALNAKRFDQSMSQIQSPRLPHLGAGDAEYLYGIAYLYAQPRPEYALVYFRRFLAVAPDSPWRRRAEEHVRELASLKFPATDSLTSSGSAAVVLFVKEHRPGADKGQSSNALDSARASLEKPMVALRTCVAKLPTTAFQISVTKVGPRTSEAARDRPMYRVPAADAVVTKVLDLDPRTSDAALSEATTCLKALALKLPLTPPKERDTYYRLSFYVVAP